MSLPEPVLAETRVTASARSGGSIDLVIDLPPVKSDASNAPVELTSSSDVARILTSGPTQFARYESSTWSWGRAEIGHLQVMAQAAASAQTICCSGAGVGYGQGLVQSLWRDTFTVDGGPAVFGQLAEMTVTLDLDGSVELLTEVVGTTAYFRISAVVQDSWGSFTQFFGGLQLRMANDASNHRVLITEPVPGGILVRPGTWHVPARFHFGRPITVTVWVEASVYPSAQTYSSGTGEANGDLSVTWGGISNVHLIGSNQVGNVTLTSASGYDYLQGTPAAIPPVNDRFENRLVLEGANVAFRGTNIATTIEPEEPSHGGDPPARSVWWEWTAPASGDVVLRIADSEFAPRLGVYTNAVPAEPPSLTALGPVEDRWCGGRPGEIYFVGLAGTTYQIAVDGRRGSRGEFGVELVMPARPLNDDFAGRVNLPSRSALAQTYSHNATREVGEPNHAGSAGSRSLWWSWTAPSDAVPGRPVTMHTAGTDYDTVLAVYTGDELAQLSPVVANDNDPLGGDTSSVTWVPQPGVSYQIAVDSGGTNTSSCLFGSSGYTQLTVDYSVLNLSVRSLRATTNADLSTAFEGQLQVQHFGLVPTRPLQIRLLSSFGPTAADLHRDNPDFTESLSIFPLSGLSPGETAIVDIQGRFGPGCFQVAGLFGILEEWLGAEWVPVDRHFLLYGASRIGNCASRKSYPVNTGLLQPAPMALPGEPQLIKLMAQVDPWLPGGSRTDFPVVGLFDDGPNRVVDPSGIQWDPIPSLHSIGTSVDSTNTTLLTGLVSTPVVLPLVGYFPFGGQRFAVRTNVTVYPRAKLNISPEQNGRVQIQLTGDRDRFYAIERIQNLAETNWTTLQTTQKFEGTPLQWTDGPSDRQKPVFYRAREIR